jgi:hypothetical protein
MNLNEQLQRAYEEGYYQQRYLEEQGVAGMARAGYNLLGGLYRGVRGLAGAGKAGANVVDAAADVVKPAINVAKGATPVVKQGMKNILSRLMGPLADGGFGLPKELLSVVSRFLSNPSAANLQALNEAIEAGGIAIRFVLKPNGSYVIQSGMGYGNTPRWAQAMRNLLNGNPLDNVATMGNRALQGPAGQLLRKEMGYPDGYRYNPGSGMNPGI